MFQPVRTGLRREADVPATAAAGVPVELHVHPAVPHGFDVIAPDAGVTLRAVADRHRILRGL